MSAEDWAAELIVVFAPDAPTQRAYEWADEIHGVWALHFSSRGQIQKTPVAEDFYAPYVVTHLPTGCSMIAVDDEEDARAAFEWLVDQLPEAGRGFAWGEADEPTEPKQSAEWNELRNAFWALAEDLSERVDP